MLRERTEASVSAARAFAKACTQARQKTLGYEHRIAESLRAIVLAAAERPGAPQMQQLCEALHAAEEHRLYELSVKARYGLEREVRRQFLQAMLREFKDTGADG